MSNTTDTFEKLKAIIIEIMANDEAEATALAQSVTAATNLQQDLDADSLDLLEIVQEIEEQFNISVSDDQAEQFTTVGQAVDAINAMQQQATA